MKKNLLLITALVSALGTPVLSMEKPEPNVANKPAAKPNVRINYIDVDETPITNHAGSNLRYYGEYRARKLENGIVSFPVNACDPLPLNTFGNKIRYFFLSATGGNNLVPGAPVKVDDPTLTNIVVVRGKNEIFGQRIEAYLGYNNNDFKTKGKNKICVAKLLALNTKDTRYALTIPYFFQPAIGCLNLMELTREIKNHLENIKDWDWKSPEFRKVMHKLLGKEWTLYESPHDNNNWSFGNDEAVIANGKFHTYKVYWTLDQNKLKGITYQKK